MRSGTYFAALMLAAALAGSNLAAQTVLEEVVVSARKREQRLQEVPLAVNAVSGEALRAAALTEPGTLAAQLPNVHVSESAIGDKLFIRGIGSGINAGFEQSVGTFVDGVYQGRGLQSRAQFLDIERVEVLRGPQSSWFGNNTIAGALNITSRRPSAAFSGLLNSRYETATRDYYLETAAGGALSDAFTVRAAGLASAHTGWIRNRITGQSEGDEKHRAGRLSLAYSRGPAFDALLKLEMASFDVTGRNLQVQDCPPRSAAAGSCALLETLPRTSALLSDAGDAISDATTAYNGPVPADFSAAVNLAGAREAGIAVPAPASWLAARDRLAADIHNANLTLSALLPGHSLTAISGYSHYRAGLRQASDFVPLPLAAIAQRENFSQFSEEVRLTSTASEAFDYVAGIYHHIASLRVRETIGFYLPPPWFVPATAWDADACRRNTGRAMSSCRLPATIAQAAVDHRQHESSQALFGAFTWHFTPAVQLGLSAHYASTARRLARSQAFYDQAPGVTVLCPAAGTAGTACAAGAPLLLAAASPPRGRAFGWRQGRLELARRDSGFSPAIHLQWKPRRTMFYGSYTTGFKAGGFDQRNLFLDTVSGQFAPEQVRAAELGMKTSARQGRMTLNLSLFQAAYDNLQVSTFDGVVNFMVNNAASARTRGIEADLHWRISERLVTSVAVALLDARWRDFRNAQCRAIDLAQAPSAVCDIDAASGLLVQDLSGQPLPMSPRHSGSFRFGWTYPLGRGLDLKVDFDMYLQSDQYLAADNDPATRQKAYGKANLRVAIASHEGWELALLIRNLTDVRTASHADDLPLGSVNSFFRLTERPRTVALQAGLRW